MKRPGENYIDLSVIMLVSVWLLTVKMKLLSQPSVSSALFFFFQLLLILAMNNYRARRKTKENQTTITGKSSWEGCTTNQ